MEDDIAYTYEKVAMFAFKCERYKDPWKIASQNKHVVFCDINRNEEAKEMLQRIIIGLILRLENSVHLHELLILEKEINNCRNQKEFNDIIIKASKLID